MWHVIGAILTTITLSEWIHFGPAFPETTYLALGALFISIFLALTASQLLRRWALHVCRWSQWNAKDTARRTRWRWRVMPICFWMLLLSPVLPPVSLPFMILRAHTLKPGEADNHPQLVGLLPVTRIARLGDGSVKFVMGPGVAIRYYPLGTKLPRSVGIMGLWRCECFTW